MNDTKRIRKGSKLPATVIPENEVDIALTLHDPQETRTGIFKSVHDLEVTAQFSANYSARSTKTMSYFSPDNAAENIVDVHVQITNVKWLCNGAWQDVTNWTNWILIDTRFSITVFARHNDDTYHKCFRVSFARGSELPSRTFSVEAPRRQAIEDHLKRSNSSSPWLREEGTDFATLAEDTILVIRVECEFPMISLRAGPWKGLQNHGCTCYLNSLMQCLFHIGAFRKFVYNITKSEDAAIYETVEAFVKTRLDIDGPPTWEDIEQVIEEELGDPELDGPLSAGELDRIRNEASTICGVSIGRLLELGSSTHGALQRLFAQMEVDSPLDFSLHSLNLEDSHTNPEYLAPPTKLVECLPLILTFGWQNEDLFMQHDVQELNRLLIDKLETVSDGDSKKQLMELFAGESQSYIECIDVDYKSTRNETYYDLQLDVRPDIEQSMHDLQDVEILENENAYDSEKYGKQKARKGVRILRFPPILQFQLKRFKFGYDSFIKINDELKFPPQLELGGDRYELIAVSVHQGELNSGHYYSYINCIAPPANPDEILNPSVTSPTGCRQWYLFDDDNVHLTNEYCAIENNYGGHQVQLPNRYSEEPSSSDASVALRADSAYVLFYMRDQDVVINLEDYKGLLTRFYLEARYRLYQERLSALIASSLIIHVPEESSIIQCDDMSTSIRCTGSWISIDSLLCYNTYLRPLSELAESTWEFLCPDPEASPPQTVDEDYVDRPTCPCGLNYLDLGKKSQNANNQYSESLDANGLIPDLRLLLAEETEPGLALWPLEYWDKEQKSTIGKNHAYLNKDLRASAGGGGSFAVLKIPIPTVFPPELMAMLRSEDNKPLAPPVGIYRQDYWRAVTLKIIDPFSMQTYFFGFANIFHGARGTKAPLSHVTQSIYSTLTRVWNTQRIKYTEMNLSSQLVKLLDMYFEKESSDSQRDGPKDTTHTAGSYPFFMPTPDNARVLLEEMTNYSTENTGYYGLYSLEHLRALPLKTPIVVLSFKPLFDLYNESKIRFEHILGNSAYIPMDKAFKEPRPAESHADSFPLIQYFDVNTKKGCVKVKPGGSSATNLPQLQPASHAAHLLRNMRSFIHIEMEVITDPARVVQSALHVELVPSSPDSQSKSSSASHTMKLCVEAEIPVHGLYSTIAKLIAERVQWDDGSPCLVEPSNLLISGTYPLASSFVTSRNADRNITRQGYGGFIWLAKMESISSSGGWFLRFCAADQKVNGYPSAFKHLISKKPESARRLDAGPIKLTVMISTLRLEQTAKIIIYNGAELRPQGLMIATNLQDKNCKLNEYAHLVDRCLLSKIYSDWRLSSGVRSLLYVSEDGLSKTPSLEDVIAVDKFPVLRFVVLEGADPWLEIVINSRPHFISFKRTGTLGDITRQLDLNMSDSSIAVLNLSDSTRRSLQDPSAPIIGPEVAEVECGLTTLYDACVTVTIFPKSKRQMTLK